MYHSGEFQMPLSGSIEWMMYMDEYNIFPFYVYYCDVQDYQEVVPLTMGAVMWFGQDGRKGVGDIFYWNLLVGWVRGVWCQFPTLWLSSACSMLHPCSDIFIGIISLKAVSWLPLCCKRFPVVRNRRRVICVLYYFPPWKISMKLYR